MTIIFLTAFNLPICMIINSLITRAQALPHLGLKQIKKYAIQCSAMGDAYVQ